MEKYLYYEYETYKIACFMENIKPLSFKEWNNPNPRAKEK